MNEELKFTDDEIVKALRYCMKIKKIFVLLLTVVLLVFTLVGCSEKSHFNDTEANLQLIHNGYFDCRVVEDLGGGCYIVADKNTNVLYLVVGGYSSSMMTPIYNSDGTVKLYEEK